MAARRTSHTSVWIVLSVAVTVLFGVFSFIWSIIQGQVNDLKSEIKWGYATKDFVIGKLDGIKEEETTYRKMLERELSRKP